MASGRIAQIGTPEDVYEQPADAYVADFLGISNLMEATVTCHGEGCCYIKLGDFEVTAGCGALDATGAVKIAVRPERVRLEPFDAKVSTVFPPWWSGWCSSDRRPRSSSASPRVHGCRRSCTTTASPSATNRGPPAGVPAA